jgi:C-terminal processing protease CtpA/Prc
VAYIDKSTGDTLTAIMPAAAKEQIDERTYSINSANDKNYDKLYYGEFEEDYAILRIKSLAYYDNDSSTVFKAFIDQFFGRMEKEHIPNLIIDLRDNWGGDPYCTAHVFSYLIDEPVPYFAESAEYYINLKLPLKPAENNYKGNVYTLINGASFSSAGHLSALLKFNDIATFLGEESGGSYLCTDSSKDIHLVNTGIRFHFATEPWEVAVSGLTPGRGIIPDYIVTPTIMDYLNNDDVVMEVAMDLITTE